MAAAPTPAAVPIALPLNTLCWVIVILAHPSMVVNTTTIKSIRNEIMIGLVSFLFDGPGLPAPSLLFCICTGSQLEVVDPDVVDQDQLIGQPPTIYNEHDIQDRLVCQVAQSGQGFPVCQVR